MSTTQEEANKAAFRRLCDAANTGDPELIATTIDAVVQPDARIGTPLPLDVTGAEAMKQVWATLVRAFPDLHVTVEELIAEDDKVVARNSVTGTQRGEYLGHPPTGRSVTYNEIFILRFAGGRIAETAGVVDVMAQLRQLGLLPGSVS
jgi:steroid delta-isomerase-like uncharacterized protein